MIRVVENMKTEKWIVKYNKDIVDDYVTYLLTGQEKDKKRLLNNFK